MVMLGAGDVIGARVFAMVLFLVMVLCLVLVLCLILVLGAGA